MELETDHFAKRRVDSPLLPAEHDRNRGELGAFASLRAAGRVVSQLAGGDSTTLIRPTTATAEVVAAHAGDHALIHSLLRAAHQQPTYQDFVSWLDEPSYAPTDRLLVKERDQIVAHVQTLHRSAMFEEAKAPVGDLQDLAVLPELASRRYDRWLLAVAERALRESHAVISIVRTDRPEPFRAARWSEARGRGYSRANVGDLLAHLTVPDPPSRRRARGLRIRLWRHVELDAVQAVYRAAIERYWGAVYRSERYWQWLIGRNAHSELIVAIDGPDDWDDLSTASRIVGYAVTHGSQVIELCCLPEHARAAPRLLERACQDAIERDYHTLSLHTPADDPLHEVMVTAGGSWCLDDRGAGGTLLVKLLDPVRWIEMLDPLLRRRTKGAGIARPCEIAFCVDGERYRLQLTRRSSRLIADESPESGLDCMPHVFSDLLVGNLHVGRAVKDGRLTIVDADVAHKLASLFPASLFWQSQFDALRK